MTQQSNVEQLLKTVDMINTSLLEVHQVINNESQLQCIKCISYMKQVFENKTPNDTSDKLLSNVLPTVNVLYNIFSSYQKNPKTDQEEDFKKYNIFLDNFIILLFNFNENYLKSEGITNTINTIQLNKSKIDCPKEEKCVSSSEPKVLTFDIALQSCNEYINRGLYYEVFQKPEADMILKTIDILTSRNEDRFSDDDWIIINKRIEIMRYLAMEMPIPKTFEVFWMHFSFVLKFKLSSEKIRKDINVTTRILHGLLTSKEAIDLLKRMMLRIKHIEGQGSPYIELSKHYLKSFDENNLL
jgi:hypothetical protein